MEAPGPIRAAPHALKRHRPDEAPLNRQAGTIVADRKIVSRIFCTGPLLPSTILIALDGYPNASTNVPQGHERSPDGRNS